MAVYVTKKCGECGKVIENRHNDPFHNITKIGVPFRECPHCGCVNVEKHVKEYNMLNSLDYVSMCMPSVYGGFGFGLIAVFVYMAVVQNTDLTYSNFVACLLFIGFGIITMIIGIKRELKNIEAEIKRSKKRLENKEYRLAIAKLIRENRSLNYNGSSKDEKDENEDPCIQNEYSKNEYKMIFLVVIVLIILVVLFAFSLK